MRNVLTKKLLLIALSVMFALCAFAGISTVKADDSVITAKSIEEITFTMTEGATPRVIEDYEDNGMTFKAVLSTADYEGLMANGYTSVTFGIVIAPAEWTEINELNEENLFGTDAKYCFSTAEAGKARIINLTTDELESDGTNYFISGSIVNYKAFNIARELVGKAYIKVVATDDTVTYKFADYFETEKENNVRSMSEVAIAAVADISTGALPTEKKNILSEQFVSRTVKVEYRLQDPEDGTYKLVTTKYLSADDGQTVTAPQIEIPGYELNEFLPDNVFSGVVDVDGVNPTLKLFYIAAKYDITYLKENGDLIYLEENITYGEGTSFGMVPRKVIGRNVYSFTGWKFADGTDASGAIKNVTQDLTVYESFTANPHKVLDEDTEKFVFANSTPGDNYRHAGVYFEVPEDTGVNDKFNISFKVKLDDNRDDMGLMMMKSSGAGDPVITAAFGEFVNDAFADWKTVTFEDVCVCTPDQFLIRFGGYNAVDLNQVFYDINTEDAGLFLFIYVLPKDSIIQFKDIEIVNMSKAGVATLTNSSNVYKHTAIKIGMPDGAQVGDKYDVSFKMNVGYDLTNKGFWAMQGTTTTASRASVDVASLTQNAWSNASLKNVAVTTGKQFKDHMLAIGFNATDFDLNNINDTDVGIFMLNYTHAAGSTISVKEVEYVEAGAVKIAAGNADACSGLLIASPDGASAGDKFDVSFKIKINFDPTAGNGLYIYLMKAVESTGATVNVGTTALSAAQGAWLEISYEDVIVTTGQQFVDRWTVLSNVSSYLDSLDTLGIYIFNYGHGGSGEILIKDVMVTAAGEEPKPEPAPLEGYNYVTPVAENANGVLVYEAAAGTKYNVSFKVRINATSVSAIGVGVLCGSTVAGAAGAAQRVSQTYTTSTDGWEDVTLNGILSMSGADMMAAATAEGWGNGFTNVDESATGIYIWSFWFGEGTTIEIKDVVVTPA